MVKTWQCFVEGLQALGPGFLLHLRCPTLPHDLGSPGQFFLVRCTPLPDVWDPYLRRALFPVLIEPGRLALWLADAEDRGVAWLVARPEGARLDLLGPGGHGFSLPPSPGRVLILAQDEGIGPVWPLIARALLAGHQVALALGVTQEDRVIPPDLLPVEVEYRLATLDGSVGRRGEVLASLEGLEGWPDHICAALPRAQWPRLRSWIEGWHPALQPGFAQVLAESDIFCGTGACLACVVERRDGRLTRACVHGPVLDLIDLA